jgi:hypothetical protein
VQINGPENRSLSLLGLFWNPALGAFGVASPAEPAGNSARFDDMDKKPIKPHPEISPDGINHDHAPQGIPRGASEHEAMGVPGGRHETETAGDEGKIEKKD